MGLSSLDKSRKHIINIWFYPSSNAERERDRYEEIDLPYRVSNKISLSLYRITNRYRNPILWFYPLCERYKVPFWIFRLKVVYIFFHIYDILSLKSPVPSWRKCCVRAFWLTKEYRWSLKQGKRGGLLIINSPNNSRNTLVYTVIICILILNWRKNLLNC